VFSDRAGVAIGLRFLVVFRFERILGASKRILSEAAGFGVLAESNRVPKLVSEHGHSGVIAIRPNRYTSRFGQFRQKQFIVVDGVVKGAKVGVLRAKSTAPREDLTAIRDYSWHRRSTVLFGKELPPGQFQVSVRQCQFRLHLAQIAFGNLCAANSGREYRGGQQKSKY
jgi:hypothetical protein